MADPTPFDLAAIEAALVPHPEGFSAWAHALCALDPRVGLRAAIAAARLVEPIWNEHFAQSQRFALTLAAAQAALDRPCPERAEEARQAATRSSQQLRGKSGVAHEAHRVALNAAEAAGFVHAPSVEGASHVFLAFLTAAKLTSPERLTGVVQVEVLGWVVSDSGPIATHVRDQLEASAAPQPAENEIARRIRLAAALGSPVALAEAGEQGLLPIQLSNRLAQWVVGLSAAYPEAAARAAISAADCVAEAHPRLDLGIDVIRSLLHEDDEEIRDRVASALHKAKRGVKRTDSAYMPLWIAGWALEAVASLRFPPARDAVCCAAKLLPRSDLIPRIQHDLLEWLGYPEPRDPMSLEPPLNWAPQLRGGRKKRARPQRVNPPTEKPSCSFFHDCGKPATREDGLCDDHRWRVDNPARVKGEVSPAPKLERAPAPTPIQPFQPPRPGPERAEWKIGHKVRVRPSMEVTCLGEGVVVDLEFVRGTETVKAALVRFEHGPADGVWYSVNTLLPHEDLLGSKLH